jgi:hypothetical protein
MRTRTFRRCAVCLTPVDIDGDLCAKCVEWCDFAAASARWAAQRAARRPPVDVEAELRRLERRVDDLEAVAHE